MYLIILPSASRGISVSAAPVSLEKGLYFIEVETYAITKEKSSYLYNKIKDYYVASLGESTVAEDGYLEFKGANKKYTYQVAMKEILLEATETEEESYGIFLLFSMK